MPPTLSPMRTLKSDTLRNRLCQLSVIRAPYFDTSQVMNGTMMVVIRASCQCTMNISAKAPMKVMMAMNRSSGP